MFKVIQKCLKRLTLSDGRGGPQKLVMSYFVSEPHSDGTYFGCNRTCEIVERCQYKLAAQLSREVWCWCSVHGDVDADVNIDVDADVDVDVPYPVESGWRPRASFDWSKAAQSTKLLWTTALDQLLWHLSWETGNTVQTNQGNALSSQKIVLGQWDDSLKHQAQKCKDESQWNGRWWFMSNTVFTTRTQICRA